MTQSPSHQVWLHVGMPKTGTTTIQKALYSNRAVLRDYGYFYPDFGDFQHLGLVRKLARLAGSTVSFPRTKKFHSGRRFLDLIDAQDRPLHTSIISSENFYQRPACVPGYEAMQGIDPFHLLSKTIEHTSAYFIGCDVRVLMWLRRQDNWLMSMYNQAIKSSLYSSDFNTFADLTIGANLFKIVQLWAHVFGKERVICRSWDTISKSKLNIVDHFMQTVAPDFPCESLSNKDGNRNPSLSYEAIWLKKHINVLVKEKGSSMNRTTRQKVGKILRDITRTSPEPNRPLLSKAERRSLMGRYLATNEKLIAEYPELWPLADIEDLSAEAESAESIDSTSPCQHAMDQLLKAYVLSNIENSNTQDISMQSQE